MNKYLLISIIFLYSLESFGQKDTNSLRLELKSNNDTVSIESGIDLILGLSNKSEKSIWIPSDYFFSSNLYPNGITPKNTGFEIRFNIQPISDWSKIYQEGSFIETETKYREIKPGSDIEIKYDIGRHIRRHLSDFKDNKNLRLGLNKKIRITAKLIYKEQKSKSSIIRLESNDIDLLLTD